MNFGVQAAVNEIKSPTPPEVWKCVYWIVGAKQRGRGQDRGSQSEERERDWRGLLEFMTERRRCRESL